VVADAIDPTRRALELKDEAGEKFAEDLWRVLTPVWRCDLC
jgi:hypothetical protein